MEKVFSKDDTSATHRTFEGQTHMANAKALAPVLAEFFGR